MAGSVLSLRWGGPESPFTASMNSLRTVTTWRLPSWWSMAVASGSGHSSLVSNTLHTFAYFSWKALPASFRPERARQ